MTNYQQDLQRLKLYGKQAQPKKYYQIPKVSAKRKMQIVEDKILFEQDKDFYKEIWAASPHTCQECNCKLGKEPLTIFFHHIMPKSIYPQFRHEPSNIAILCLECHSKCETNIDFAPKTKLRKLQIEKNGKF